MNEKETYTCSLCHKTFTKEEADEKLLCDFPDHGVTLCMECAERAMQENIVKAINSGSEINKKYVNQNGQVMNPAAVMRDEALANKEQMEGLNHIRKIVSTNTPAKIKAHLDEYIIGQDNAKRILSVAVYNHYKRVMFDEMMKIKKSRGETIQNKSLPSQMKKSSILMLGPTGSGKTALLKALADYLDVPFAVTDTSSLTEAGYVGQDPETCVKNLYFAAGNNIEKAEHGIIFLDEFDKIARKTGTNRSTTSDPGHEGIQQALLKIIEGTVVNFNPSTARRNPDMPGVFIDTSNILFICGGAFEGIEDIIDKRVGSSNGFGFGKEDKLGLEEIDDDMERYNTLIDHLETEDVREYGILPEMLGRLPIICKLHQLGKEDLIHILTQPKDAIMKQFRWLFKLDGCELSIDKEALERIAEKALETKTGARALRTIVENLFLDTMYELPDKAAEGNNPIVRVSKDNVDSKELAVEYRTAA